MREPPTNFDKDRYLPLGKRSVERGRFKLFRNSSEVYDEIWHYYGRRGYLDHTMILFREGRPIVVVEQKLPW